MNTNAWVAVTEFRAQQWRAWAEWNEGGRHGPEPPLDDYARAMFNHIVDWRFSFAAFKLAVIDSVTWRMGNVYGVVPSFLQAGYAAYWDEWKVIGYWDFEWLGNASRQRFDFPWDPALALLFMPDVCIDPPECTQRMAATELADVSLLHAQPPREFASEARG